MEKNIHTEFLPQGEKIFALDIGTRSVIGVVGEVDGDSLRVLALERVEHTKRAMIDGQIEDIEQVAKVARIVKERLEERTSTLFTHVCVAAAGRSLKTQKASYECEIEEKQQISRNQVTGWELEAVQLAYNDLLDQRGENIAFSCVGYSVMKYYLNDYPISTLVDHRGAKIKVDIVATFLPNEVIESLYEVASRVGLTVLNLTLEPIAAMNAIIPQELRMLNLALVDIGAGTSDIAISSGGSVIAYTMVTIAGDEITEALVQQYLVDFDTAETIKLQLSTDIDRIQFQDVIGIEYDIPTEEILEAIQPCTLNLCTNISKAILEINGKNPAAVFLVGGGSGLARMSDMVAEQLDIPQQKVAVGGSNYMKKMIKSDFDISAADYATPLGIAITAMNLMENSSIVVNVNDVPVSLFKSSAITAMDALLMSGYKQNQLIGRSGQSVTFERDGQKIVARGSYPTPALIQVNGKPASLTTPINHGDELSITAATVGLDAKPKISEYIENFETFIVTFNGDKTMGGVRVKVNDELVINDMVISNFDVVETEYASTVGELATIHGFDANKCAFSINDDVKVDASYKLAAYDDIIAIEKDSFEDRDIQPVQPVQITTATPTVPPQPVEPSLPFEEVESTNVSEERLMRPFDEPVQQVEEKTPMYEMPKGVIETEEETERQIEELKKLHEQGIIPQLNEDEYEIKKKKDIVEEEPVPIPPSEPEPELAPGDIYIDDIVPDDDDEFNYDDYNDYDDEEFVDSPLVQRNSKVLNIHINNEPTVLEPKSDNSAYLFFDMLNYVDIDPNNPQGNIILKLNGRSAEFLDNINDGDSVEIYWEINSNET